MAQFWHWRHSAFKLFTYFAIAIAAHLAAGQTIAMESLDNVFAKAVAEKRVPGIAVAALNRDGSIIYKNSWGTVDIDDPSSAPMTSTTKIQIASMTKVVVSVAALQLLEQGKLSMNDLVEDYIPAWENITVLDGFDANDKPILRAPKTKATTLHLFTHTAGPGAWFLNENLNKYSLLTGKPGQIWADPLHPDPLASDPGTAWNYGHSTDYLGHVIEAISGLRLDVYIGQNILQPLGLTNTGLVSHEIHSHFRDPNDTITSTPPVALDPSYPPFGGGYLVSTLDDYSNFLLTLVNYGTHPISGVTLLQPSTVKDYLFTDLLALALSNSTACKNPNSGGPIPLWNSLTPSLSNSYEFLPGTAKGWSAGFLVNNEDIKGRRRKGGGTWAGIFNSFYWVDLEAGKLGVVFTNLLPFLDGEVLALFERLEREVYK